MSFSDPYIFKEASMFNVKVGGEDVDSYIASFFQMPLADRKFLIIIYIKIYIYIH